MTDLPDPVEQREWRRQEAAERSPSGADGDPEVEIYRRVYTAVREAELPGPPPGFALRMEQTVFASQASNRAEAGEEWGVRLGLFLMLILMLATAAPAALSWFDRWWGEAPAPWLPAAASGAALLIWSLVDRRRSGGAASAG